MQNKIDRLFKKWAALPARLGWGGSLSALFLMILGFSSACNQNPGNISNNNDTDMVAKYGCPQAVFIVKGSVLSDEGSSAIPNIRVMMNGATASTGAGGDFTLESVENPDINELKLRFDDIDGQENGEYVSLDTIVNVEDAVFKDGTDEWDRGNTQKEIVVRMKRKKR